MDVLLGVVLLAYVVYGQIFCGMRIYRRAGRAWWWIFVPVAGQYIWLRMAGLSKGLAGGLLASIFLMMLMASSAQGSLQANPDSINAQVPIFLSSFWLTAIFAYATMRIARSFGKSWWLGVYWMLPLLSPLCFIIISRSTQPYVEPTIESPLGSSDSHDRTMALVLGLLISLVLWQVERLMKDYFPEQEAPKTEIAQQQTVDEELAAPANQTVTEPSP